MINPIADFANISKHIKINNQNAQRMLTTDITGGCVAPTMETPTICILDVIDCIKDPFRPAKDLTGYIYDSSVIAVICGRGHPHRYLIRDILAEGLTKCKTCTCGSRTIQLMRELLETTLGTTFIISTTKYDTVDSTEFYNRKLELVVSFIKTNMFEVANNNQEESKYKIVRCSSRSLSKFKQEIYEQLTTYARLSDKQRVAVNALVGIYHDDPTSNAILGVKTYNNAQLPLSEEMAADIVKKNPTMNPIAITLSLNIVSDAESKYLCIENC